MNDTDRDALVELLGELFDGELSDSRREQLESILAADPAARSFYRRYTRVHARLDSQDVALALPHVLPPPRRSLRKRILSHDLGVGVAVAIFAVGALLVALAWTPVSSFIAGDDPVDSGTASQPVEIATLTNWHRPEWVKAHAISPRDHRIQSGQKIAFTSGLIEITYDTGAKVVIEGPAEFVAGNEASSSRQATSRGDDLNGGFLALGKLVASCDTPASKGFTVATRTARVVDLGTEFGVEVSGEGAAEFAVFGGEVELITGDGMRPLQRVRLSKGQSAFVAADSLDIEPRGSIDDQRIAAMRMRLETVLQGQAGELPPPTAQGKMTWVAYHDLGGQASPGNITTQADLAGSVELVKFADGSATGVTLRISGAKAIDTRTADNEGGPPTRPPNAGTPAAQLFGDSGLDLDDGFVTVQGGTMTLAVAGLKPDQLYDVALYGDRDEADDGVERFVMRGPVGGENRSSIGIISTTTTKMKTRPNDAGHIVRWTSLAPGADGSFAIDISTENRNIAYISAVRLAEHESAEAGQPEAQQPKLEKPD